MKLHELEEKYERKVIIKDPYTVFREMSDIKKWNKEAFAVFYLNSRSKVISREIISIGILNSVIVHPREIFRTAIIRNANAIIVAHNHPSGNLEPSAEDIEITNKLRQSGDIIGIKLFDHVIVSNEGYYSFSDRGKL
jgi:DNA repair protein RadC